VSSSKLCDPSGNAKYGKCFQAAGHSAETPVVSSINGG